MKNDLVKKFWLGFLRNAEGVEGGGAGAGGSSGTETSEGAAASEAGAETAAPAPASTFLTEAAKPVEGGEEAKPAEAAAEAAPEAFDTTKLTLPEGVTVDEEASKAFSDILADPALSAQERGQKLFDLHSANLQELQKSVSQQMQDANKATWEKMNNDWRSAIKELPEFKNNPDAEAGKVMQALKSVGAGEEFFAALNLTGAGNNPAILQVLHRMAQPFIEGGAVSGAGKAGAAKQLGANMYTSTARP